MEQILENILQEINRASRRMCTNEVPAKYYRAIGTRKADEIIRKHLSGKETDVLHNAGWIPVKERLPEWEGRYLVTFRNPKNVGLVGYGTCRRDLFGREIGFGWYDLHEAEYFSRDAVIAWMPLPEPYREEREG